MADLREGPRASVVLSCEGCRHFKNMGRHVRSWCSARGEWSTFTDMSVTPDWCPLHPGPLVAVQAPEKASSCLRVTEYGAGPFAHSASENKGWNACRSEIIQRARALGQEVTDV